MHAISHTKKKCLYFAKMYLNTKWAWNKFTSIPTIKIKKEMLKKHKLCCVFITEIWHTTLFSHNLDDLAKITETCGLGFCFVLFLLDFYTSYYGLEWLKKWIFSHFLQTELYDYSGVFFTSMFFFWLTDIGVKGNNQ